MRLSDEETRKCAFYFVKEEFNSIVVVYFFAGLEDYGIPTPSRATILKRFFYFIF